MASDLQKAIDSLTLRDVYLRSSSTGLHDEFEPKYEPELDALEVQFKHVVTQSNVLELEEEGQAPAQLFRVFVELGTRWTRPGADEAADAEVLAHIEGVMIAEYAMEPNPGPDALKAFALNNASYHVWPYWREFLSTQCLRMNLPKLVIPARQFAVNRTEP